MKKPITFLVLIVCFYATSHAQSKFTFGLKGGAQYVDPKLYEFFDPFPFYKYDQGGGARTLYGNTSAVSGAVLGLFGRYSLLKSNRIKTNAEIIFNRRGYSQQDATQNRATSLLIIKKNYLDVNLSFMLFPFKNAGFFIEPGINQAFLLSNKTKFPDTDNASSEFEKRRTRALIRETNLTGFKIGAGWDFKKFDLSAGYQTDKQYEYIHAALRYKLIN